MNEESRKLQTAERDCHRLQAVLETGFLKCIRELIRRRKKGSRIRMTHVKCFE